MEIYKFNSNLLNIFKILALFFILDEFLILKVNGIRCYVCNSKQDPNCGDPFDPATIEHVDCAQYLDERKNSTFCRKQYQRASLGERADLRVVRTCGYIVSNKQAKEMKEAGKSDILIKNQKTAAEIAEDEDHANRCFTRAGTFEVMVTYCTCRNDKCNGSPFLQLSSFLLFLAPLLLHF